MSVGLNQLEAEPPTIRKEGRVVVHTPGGTRVAGWLGTIPERGDSGFVAERDSHLHRIRALDAYAISLTALRILEQAECGYVLVHETDTDAVYEWKATAFIQGNEVADRYLQHSNDPQRFCKRDSARAIWRDHGSELYRSTPSPDVNEEVFAPASDLDTDANSRDDDANSRELHELSDEERLELAFERAAERDANE